ncbi:phosphotransferase [Streptomyces tendae]|uniref:phosphotransferase n=1 Tax=Streptomyces tendae TaxID=1932 RepID=UPI0024923305|nr:phosphotransferase [Streptomyces tendae]
MNDAFAQNYPNVDWHGSARAAKSAEIEAVTTSLATAGIPLPSGVPAVVFAYPGHGVGERHPELSGCTNQVLLLSQAYDNLAELGVPVAALSTEAPEKHAHVRGPMLHRIVRPAESDAEALPHVIVDGERCLTRFTLLLGGSHDGLLVEDVTDSVAHTRAVLNLITTERLGTWARAAGQQPDGRQLTVSASFRKGADSEGIVAFDPGVRMVAKVGPTAVIEAEADFIARVNDHLGGRGLAPVFPVLHGVHRESGQATVLMEQADPVTLDEAVFDDVDRFRLREDAVATLEPHLDLLQGLYRTSTRQSCPTAAPYLYRERFHVIPKDEGFVRAFRSFFPDWDLRDVLGASVRLPDNRCVPGYQAQTGWLDLVHQELLPETGCLVHGDVHLKNMLRRTDGTPVFVDPRTVWDGRERPDIGYGDPAYDMATLLHSALPMSGLLHAIATDATERLLPELPERPTDGVLDLGALTVAFETSGPLLALEERLLSGLPDGEGPATRARLYVGAANALAGWLKYERAMGSPRAWLTLYAFTLWYLDRARGALGETRED